MNFDKHISCSISVFIGNCLYVPVAKHTELLFSWKNERLEIRKEEEKIFKKYIIIPRKKNTSLCL